MNNLYNLDKFIINQVIEQYTKNISHIYDIDQKSLLKIWKNLKIFNKKPKKKKNIECISDHDDIIEVLGNIININLN